MNSNENGPLLKKVFLKLVLFLGIAVIYSTVLFSFFDTEMNFFLFSLEIFTVIISLFYYQISSIPFIIRLRKIKLLSISLSIIVVLIVSSVIEIQLSSTLNLFRWLFVLLINMLIYFFFLFRKSVAQRPEKLFLSISLSIGIFLAITLPIYSSWDAQIHYSRSVSMSFIGDAIYTKADLKISNMEFKKKLINITPSIASNLEKNYKYDNVFITHKSYNLIYQNLGYLPSAFMIFLGRHLHLPFIIVFMMGRIGNVLLYSLVTYFAIKKANTGKMIIAVISLFPTALFIASEYSYDFWVTAFTILGISYLLSEIRMPDKQLKLKDCAIMIGSLIVACGPKAIYFPIMFLLYFIKKTKFKNQKYYRNYLIVVTVSIVLVILSFMLPFLISTSGVEDVRGGAGVDSSAQLHYILSSPVEYFKTLIHFISKYTSLTSSKGYVTFIAYLGYGTSSVWVLLLSLLFFVSLTDREDSVKQIGNLYNVANILVNFATVCLVCTALYIGFTPVKLNTINGVSIRYLMPLIYPIFSMLLGFNIIKNISLNKTMYNNVVLSISTICLLLTFYATCFTRYM